MSELIRVGILRGGPSSEHEVSLNTGAAVLAALRDRYDGTYDARDIIIDRAGNWRIDGALIGPGDAHRHIDVAFIALHGAYGEDGTIQSILESHGIPFTGSDSFSSAIGMNKIMSKKALEMHGIKSPYWKEVLSSRVAEDPGKESKELFQSFIMPMVVKPARSGSSVGVSIARSFSDLEPALRLAAEHGHSILIEEFVPGIEATCGVIEGFRGKEYYALPPVEIRVKNGFFDYQAKYAGGSEEIVPARFPESLKREIEEMAIEVHKALGLRHYSRTDFIIHPRRGVYVLETNTLPGLTNESLMPKALRAVGSGLHELADHLIRLAMRMKRE